MLIAAFYRCERLVRDLFYFMRDKVCVVFILQREQRLDAGFMLISLIEWCCNADECVYLCVMLNRTNEPWTEAIFWTLNNASFFKKRFSNLPEIRLSPSTVLRATWLNGNARNNFVISCVISESSTRICHPENKYRERNFPRLLSLRFRNACIPRTLLIPTSRTGNVNFVHSIYDRVSRSLNVNFPRATTRGNDSRGRDLD